MDLRPMANMSLEEKMRITREFIEQRRKEREAGIRKPIRPETRWRYANSNFGRGM